MNGCEQYYVIKQGDTLYKIAEMFNTTVENIIRLNSGIAPDNLRVGMRICVVSATFQPIRCPVGSVGYNINEGDTLRDIAVRFGTTVDAILDANPTLDPFNLPVGRRICIDRYVQDKPNCQTGNFYIIRQGDSLYKISQTFDISVSDILRLNPGINPQNLSVGDVLCIPLSLLPLEIVVNISEKRLAVYRSGSLYREYIIATGTPQTPTPVGVFEIVNKQIDPGGPYGSRWMGLSIPTYGIHGTNNPSSIGTAASNGCIRMYNEDVEALFSITPVGTTVRILP